MPENSFSLWRLWPDFSLIFQSGLSSAQGLSALIVALLLILLGCFLFYSFLKAQTARSHIAFYRKLLAGYSRDQLWESRETLLHQSQKVKKYAPLWKSFDETLISNEHQQRLFNPYGADYLFNTHTLARGLTENRLLAAMPGVLTAIGVIGTFAGLQMGLSALQLNDVGHVDGIKDGIFAMIGGASIAFMTSVWGVLTSLIFNVVEKSLERGVKSEITQLQWQINGLYPLVSAEQSLVNIEQKHQLNNEYMGSMHEFMGGMATEIGDQFEKALHRTSINLQHSMSETFTKTLGSAMETMVSEALKGFESSMTQVQARNVEVMEAASQTQQGMMKTLGETQKQMLLDVSEAQQQVVTTIGDSQRKLLSQVSEDLQGTMQGLEEKFSQFVSHLDQHTLAMTESNQTAMSELSKAGQTLLKELMSNSESSLMTLSERSQSVVSDMTQSIQAQFAEQNQLDMQRRETLNEQFEGLAKQIGQAAKAMESSVTTVFERTEALVTQNVEAHGQLQQLLGTLDAISARIEQSASSLNEAAKVADNGFSAVHDGFAQLAESLKGHIGDLNQQVANLLKDYSTRVEEQTVERLNVWNEQTSDYITAMTQAVKAVNTVVNEIEGKVGSAAA